MGEPERRSPRARKSGSREGQRGTASAPARPSTTATEPHQRRHRRQPCLPLGDPGALTARARLAAVRSTAPVVDNANVDGASFPGRAGAMRGLGHRGRTRASRQPATLRPSDPSQTLHPCAASSPSAESLFPVCSPQSRKIRALTSTKAPQTRGFSLVGETGFEPATARPPAGCATRLRHSPWILRTERATGIEPALEAWKASVQPQHFARQLAANPTAPGHAIAGRV